MFDWKNPNYVPVLQDRLDRLAWLRADLSRVPAVMAYYRDHPADFINDWGVTYDPRNVDVGLPPIVPFLLFPKQREWIDWTVERWKSREPGMTEKSRDAGVSWLAVSLAATLCLTHAGVSIGFGSRKEDYVDKSGSPDSLFWKCREFIKRLPREFTGGWDDKADSVHMLIRFPHTGSTISGEAGDNIGRGGRNSIFFVDEAASLERPLLVDAALSQTTNCRIDVSTPRGMANSFAQKRHGGRIPVFTFHWRDDPRKDDEWYAKQQRTLDPVTLAQEVDLSYAASATGILIPAEWVNAAIDADKKLGVTFRGDRRGALDIADEGIDLNAFARGQGMRVENVTAWSGKGSDTVATTQHAFQICDEENLDAFNYDADGLGAGARGDARIINAARAENGLRQIKVTPFRGSGEVFKPDDPIPTAHSEPARDRTARKNGDYFLNFNAQAFWDMRVRFQRTFRAVEAGSLGDYAIDDLICLAGDMSDLGKIVMELSQPTYKQTTSGKIQVVKTPQGARSPNYADAIKQFAAPRKKSFIESI